MTSTLVYRPMAKSLVIIGFSILASGCASIMQANQLNSFEQEIQNGQLKEASNYAISQADLDQASGQPSSLLWSLQAGAMLRSQGEFKKSNQFFDASETLIKQENTTSLAKNALRGAGSILTNDAAIDYSPAIYDGIMANTYKALNFMAEHKNQDARIEWNRVADRQRRAAEHFAKQISKLKAEQEKEAGKNNREVAKSVASSEKILAQQGMDMSQWAPYKGYINPFSTYMHGLFFMLNAQTASDYNKAYDSMRRAYGLTKNTMVKADMYMAKNLANGFSVKRYKPTVWVVYESGLSVKKEERRIDLPIFLVDDNVKYTGIALPELVSRSTAYPNLRIGRVKTTTLANMDKIIQAEFKQEFPYILGKEIARATIKTVVQKQLNDQDPLAGMIMAGYQMASTSADIRMWTSLPKEFQLARLPKTGNSLKITADGMPTPIDVALDKDSRFSIVYVKAFNKHQPPHIEVINI